MIEPVPESGPRPRLRECRAAYHRGEGTLVLGGDPTPCAACGQTTRDFYEVRGHRFHQGCLVPAEADVVRLAFAGKMELTVLDPEVVGAVDAALSAALHAALHAFEAEGAVRVEHTVRVAVQKSDDLSSVAALVGCGGR